MDAIGNRSVFKALTRNFNYVKINILSHRYFLLFLFARLPLSCFTISLFAAAHLLCFYPRECFNIRSSFIFVSVPLQKFYGKG